MAISKIVIMLLMAKFLFTLLKAMITKGVLSNISNRPRFQSYSSNSKSEIPVIPPSRKWFGTKKLFRANVAEHTLKIR
jgi:hypothetical protein